MINSRPILLGATALAIVLSACGDDDTSALADREDIDLVVVALDSNDFDEDAYTVAAGEIAVAYEHGGNIHHTLLIDGIDEDEFKLEVNRSGDVDEGTVQLDAGEYTIFCDVPGHRQAGMEATLTVE